MTLRLALIVTAFLSIYGCQSGTPSSESNVPVLGEGNVDGLYSQVKQQIALLVHEGNSAGITFGLQVGDASPVIETYGFADVERAIPVKTETCFNLASLTKPFTATAIALLVQQDKLHLDDKLSLFFPDFPDGDAVTVYHLLSHTSGIADWWMRKLPDNTPDNWQRRPEPHKVLAKIDDLYLFEPGSQYAYTSSGFILLGEIIEHVSGEEFEIFLQNNIFSPLGMKHTAMAEIGDSISSAKGYTPEQDSMGQFIPHTFNLTPFPAGSLGAAGGLASNINDLLSWSNALLSGDFLETDLLDEMTAYAHVDGDKPVYEALYTPPGMPAQTTPDYMQKNGYGLGFSRTEFYGTPAIWHSGGMPGFNSIWVYLPESKTTFIVLSNTSNGAVPAFDKVMKILTEDVDL